MVSTGSYKMTKRGGNKPFFAALGFLALAVALIWFVPKIYSPEKYEDRYTYNYFDFIKRGGTWFTQAQVGGNLLALSLRNGPRELEGIPVKGNIAEFRDTYSFVFITFDPSEENHNRYVTMSNAEVAPNLVLHFGMDIEPACTIEHEVCNESGTRVVTCDSTTEGVIFLNHAPGPSVEVRDNCAIITGLENELVHATDRFMYGLYGIMK